MRPVILAMALLGLCALAGCSEHPDLVATVPSASEIPVADLPESMRPKNWTDAYGSGSCVNASTVYMLRWRNMLEQADWWRQNHAGGETATSIRNHHDRAGIPYRYTTNADPAFLEWATRTRRGAIIWYYPSHCVTFVGFHRDPATGVEYAYLNDNNRPSRHIKIERSEFLRKWAGYGGFALSILAPPVPPKLFPAYVARS